MVPINSSTSLQSYSKNTIGFHITMNFFSGSTYIDGLTFFTVIIYIYSSLNPFLKFTYRFTICKLYFIWLKVHQGISFVESVFRGPCFCRHMNKADEFILCIPDDATCKLWVVYKGPTNVSIHTEDGRLFNVGLSASKGFSVGIDVITEVAPIDVENEVGELIHGGVRRFVRMAGERYFRIPDPVSRMARLDEGLRDITVRLMHLDPPQQFTNGTRRERKSDGGWPYALTSWKKFMKAARIKMRANEREMYRIDMILMDEMGTKIQASCLHKLFSKFERHLIVGECLIIKRPSLAANTTFFKIVPNNQKLSFYYHTFVEKCKKWEGP
ncbi:putative nucleic acid-binding protein [Helianthus annuus]|nr:putative nucleic acid-binding protein [Helianthus annuus]